MKILKTDFKKTLKAKNTHNVIKFFNPFSKGITKHLFYGTDGTRQVIETHRNKLKKLICRHHCSNIISIVMFDKDTSILF